jgi:RimJ/RimL family protein N-acetyltransferase
VKKRILLTPRLILRNWQDKDRLPFAKMCANPEVMQYFPKPLSTKESTNLIDRFIERYEQNGYTYFALEVKDTAQFIGFIGMLDQTYKSSFTPNVDIGWRLRKDAWGKGYATEAAQACIDNAASLFGIKKLISVASHDNLASINVMEKIGMKFQGKFEHPSLTEYPHLNPCVWYSINL